MFAAQPQTPGDRAALLAEHVAALARLDEEPRPSARERLEEQLGPELTKRLLGALVGDKPMRTDRLVA